VQTNLQVITNLLDFGRDPQQAVEDPRWSRGERRSVGLEARAPEHTVEGLRTRGHQVEVLGPYGQGGRAQVITVGSEGVLTAGSDPRCDGCALTY
jgi:gamma-glutamyltranspeptidase/glutathione hydrolase